MRVTGGIRGAVKILQAGENNNNNKKKINKYQSTQNIISY
jgi:hypothetical protein